MSRMPLLLAMHSSTERFGVALQDPSTPASPSRALVFEDGRGLSNTLISRVEALLPRQRWCELDALAVATGPGGFTGTRLSVVMARTLAQQLDCPLLGLSSYALMAARLARALPESQQPFWISRVLPRRGRVGGRYAVREDQVEELVSPRLLADDQQLAGPVLDADERVEEDVLVLLQRLRDAWDAQESRPWQTVLPIYPTSPVGAV